MVEKPISLLSCGRSYDVAAEAPPPAKVLTAADQNLFSVDHPKQFPLAAVVARASAPELVVTGAVNPDIARNVPLISLATGRVVAFTRGSANRRGVSTRRLTISRKSRNWTRSETFKSPPALEFV